MWHWVVNCTFYVVFFFKQKTAYEMRISDWSSDVCSSDLIRTKPRAPLPRYAASLCLLADERVDLVDEAHQRNRLRDIGVGARRADAFLVLAARIGRHRHDRHPA